jgi:hypothetical protein
MSPSGELLDGQNCRARPGSARSGQYSHLDAWPRENGPQFLFESGCRAIFEFGAVL